MEQLPAWAAINGVRFHDKVRIERIDDDGGGQGGDGDCGQGKGYGVRAVGDVAGGGGGGGGVGGAEEAMATVLVTVPHDLVLSRELVWQAAKVDRHLGEVLEATGEFGQVCT